MRDFERIRNLVGEITVHDLKHVDSYVCEHVGIFAPSTGFCGYATRARHTHPTYSFVILLKKSESVLHSQLQPDENSYIAAMLPPDVPHEEKQEEEFTRYIAIMASKHLVESIFSEYDIRPAHKQSWHDFFVPKEILVFIARFMEEYEAGFAEKESVLGALGFLIIHDLIRSAYEKSNHELLPKSGIVRKAVEFINQNFHSNISVSELAANAGLSVSAFSRKFSGETGFSPAAYILDIRLVKAKKLMRCSEQSITEISQSCGFSSAAHFSSAFKKRYGFTPSEYRLLYANI